VQHYLGVFNDERSASQSYEEAALVLGKKPKNKTKKRVTTSDQNQHQQQQAQSTAAVLLVSPLSTAAGAVLPTVLLPARYLQTQYELDATATTMCSSTSSAAEEDEIMPSSSRYHPAQHSYERVLPEATAFKPEGTTALESAHAVAWQYWQASESDRDVFALLELNTPSSEGCSDSDCDHILQSNKCRLQLSHTRWQQQHGESSSQWYVKATEPDDHQSGRHVADQPVKTEAKASVISDMTYRIRKIEAMLAELASDINNIAVESNQTEWHTADMTRNDIVKNLTFQYRVKAVEHAMWNDAIQSINSL
jgi:hypothetical protein